MARAYLNIQLERQIQGVYLDGWTAYYESSTAEQRNAMLQLLRNIGYVEIFADFTGNLDANHTGITGAYLNIDENNWIANVDALEKVKSYDNISKVNVHIASSGTLEKFNQKPTNEQREIFNAIRTNQKTQGFNFVFPILPGTWDTIDEIELPPDDGRKRYIRMIVWARPFDTSPANTFPHWQLFIERALNSNDGSWYNLAKDYTAEDVIELIADLQPRCLERFITGTGNRGPGMPVPTRPGNPTMTFEQFLQKAMDAGAPGCYIVPKLDLTWLGDVKRRGDDPMNDETIFWRSARTLYNLDINPPIRTICLDCWDNFRTNFPEEEERNQLLDKLRNMGFESVELNFTGANNLNHSQIDVAKFNIQTNNWTVNTTALDRFKGWQNIKDYLLYIDYPGPMDRFLEQHTNLPHPGGYADRQADVLISNIINRQAELGFTYVFPFFQNGYDPKTFITNPNGKYKGKTMYDIQKELLWYGKIRDLVED